jgi:hypothetical protein
MGKQSVPTSVLVKDKDEIVLLEPDHFEVETEV